MRRATAGLLVGLALACGSPPGGRPGGDGARGDGAPPGPDTSGVDPDLELVGTWGGYGTEPGQFIEPSSVDLDGAGFVWVAGHEDRVQKFTADGELVDIVGASGTGEGEFNHPHGLAITRAGEELVYVGDQENGRVQVFTPDGAFVRLWTDARFEHIHDVGIDPDSGDIYVGDYELDVLQKFTATGTPVWQIAASGDGPGEFDGVWGISTDSSGNVYAADTGNRRVQKFDRDGAYLLEWSGDGARGFEKPTGVFVDADDVVHVCDSLADEVLRFAADGSFLGRWSLTEVVGETSEPEDIVLDPTGAHLYIGEVRNHRVLHLVRRDSSGP